MPTSLRIEIFSSDLDATVAFWTQALGFVLERDVRAASAPYVALRRGDALVGAAHRERVDVAARRPPVGVEIVLEVDDLDAARAGLHEAGVRVDEDLTDRPWGLRDFRVVDPDGYYVRVTTHWPRRPGRRARCQARRTSVTPSAWPRTTRFSPSCVVDPTGRPSRSDPTQWQAPCR